MNKKKLLTIIIVVISVAILTLASALIYNYAFKEKLEIEKGSKIINEELQKNEDNAAKLKEKAIALAKEYNVIGTYASTYNDIEDGEDSGYMYTPTKKVTSVMTLNDDLSASFNDGASGWWSLVKDDKGFITVTVGVQGEDETRDYLFCQDTLIDLKNAVFWGTVPESTTFDGEFKSGNLTLTFKNDGSIDGLYSEIVEENGQKFPWNEAYSGTYKRNGDFIDIVLNGSEARYMIFEAVGNDAEKPISGFAARYYTKAVA